MEAHPIAALWPALGFVDLDALAVSIAEQGLIYPIVTYEGCILDGRARFAACKRVGVEPHFKPYTGSDPTGYCLAANGSRRHARYEHRALILAPLAQGDPKLARRLAEQYNLSFQNMSLGRRIHEKGIAELTPAVLQGKLSLTRAASIALLPREVQLDAMSHPGAYFLKAQTGKTKPICGRCHKFSDQELKDLADGKKPARPEPVDFEDLLGTLRR